MVAEWVESEDAGLRFDALAIVNKYRLVHAVPALRRLQARLESDTSPGAPYEWAKVTRILGNLTAPGVSPSGKCWCRALGWLPVTQHPLCRRSGQWSQSPDPATFSVVFGKSTSAPQAAQNAARGVSKEFAHTKYRGHLRGAMPGGTNDDVGVFSVPTCYLSVHHRSPG